MAFPAPILIKLAVAQRIMWRSPVPKVIQFGR